MLFMSTKNQISSLFVHIIEFKFVNCKLVFIIKCIMGTVFKIEARIVQMC